MYKHCLKFKTNVCTCDLYSICIHICRNREILELGLDNEDSEHENDEDTNQSKSDNYLLIRSRTTIISYSIY